MNNGDDDGPPSLFNDLRVDRTTFDPETVFFWLEPHGTHSRSPDEEATSHWAWAFGGPYTDSNNNSPNYPSNEVNGPSSGMQDLLAEILKKLELPFHPDDEYKNIYAITEKLNFLPSEKPGREECVKALKNAYVVPKDENASEIQVFQKVLEWIEESGDSDRGSNTTPLPPYS